MESKLQIGFDPGASLSKIVYAVNGAAPKILMMEPDVLSLSDRSVQHLQLTAQPENQAWIRLNRKDPQAQACGFLARELSAVERIELLKYEHAFYKFLAAVGAIVVREGIQSLRPISVEAALLLPYGEIHSRDWLGQKIAQSLKNYYFQNTLIRGQLLSYYCGAEGSGMLYQLLQQRGMEWIQQHRVTLLNFGYRNISCLTLNRGAIEMQYSATTDLGFVKLIDRVIARTPGQNRYSLVQAVYAIAADVRLDHPELRSLIRSTHSDNILAEAKLLVNAIDIARYEYWQIVQDWLNSVVPNDLDHLMITGGTSLYLKPLLENHFDWAIPQWHSSRDGELAHSDSCLQSRFGDVMALFASQFLLGKAA